MKTDWDAVEFTKTRGWEARDRSDDELTEYGGLLAWCARRRLLPARGVREYSRQARERPEQGRAACADAAALRALIYDALRGVAARGTVTSTQLAQASDWVDRFSSIRRLRATAGGIRWDWEYDRFGLDHPLAPVAWSLGELLVAPELARVRLCDGDGCGWMFVDGSRAGSRRWCDAAECGNLDRVRRFRSRLAARR